MISIHRPCAAALVALTLAASGAHAANLSEAVSGDFSNDHLNPTPWALAWGQVGNNGLSGNNVISGSVGSTPAGTDRDYIAFTVPTGYVLSQLLVGNITTVGGNGSFIGLGAGSSIAIDPTKVSFGSSAAGLMGYRIYGVADHGTDILDNLAQPFNGTSGFSVPLGAGTYTLWIQELSSSGPYTYRFNLMLEPAAAVPEPSAPAMLAAGLLALGLLRRRLRVRVR